MNELECFGVFFFVIIGVALLWVIGFFVLGDDSGEDKDRALVAFLFTTIWLVVLLTATIAGCIGNDRKNEEYKKIISEYEENKEVINEGNN